MAKLSDQAREARNAYYREYRAKTAQKWKQRQMNIGSEKLAKPQ